MAGYGGKNTKKINQMLFDEGYIEKAVNKLDVNRQTKNYARENCSPNSKKTTVNSQYGTPKRNSLLNPRGLLLLSQKKLQYQKLRTSLRKP